MKDSNSNTPSKWKGRKVVFTIVAIVIFCGAFLLMRPLSDMQFGIWTASILTTLGIYGGANVAQKYLVQK